MGTAFITRRGGGKPRLPTNWAFLQLITSNLTWSAPDDGWYRIYCVGKSGDGGNGDVGHNIQERNYGGGGGGAGGNSGGVGCSALFLKAGTGIAATVNTSLTSFGSYLSAACGGTGGKGSKSNSNNDPSKGGIVATVVGSATGGNLSNASGLYGGAGGHGGYGSMSNILRAPQAGSASGGNSGGGTETNTGNTGGGGGAGSNLQIEAKYYLAVNKTGGKGMAVNGLAGWGSTANIVTPPRFTGAGGGGGGGGTSATTGGAGGLGCPGGIIIEKGVT